MQLSAVAFATGRERAGRRNGTEHRGRQMKGSRWLVIAAALAAAGCGARGGSAPPAELLPSPIPPVAGEPRVLQALRGIDFVTGTGEVATEGAGQCLYVHYTGWLRDGTRFDSSRQPAADGTPRQPISFPQGFRRVIAGWDLGFDGMRVGGQRRLFIPFVLAYGEAGRPPVIPARAELIFDVELMAVADTLPRQEGAPAPRCATWEEVRPAAP
jgi:peptidylprolyl isomerase